MGKLVNRKFLLVFLSLAVLFCEAVPAQEPAQSPLPVQITTDVQAPNPKGSNPKPGDAGRAVLAAFDKYEVVGMSAAHGNKDLDDFILHLIRNPAFPNKVNDVVVACGNILYQPILDRYIVGGTESEKE